MSNYLPDYMKKQHGLARRESRLLCALDRDESAKKIAAAAEQVRQARLGAIRSEKARLPPRDGPGLQKVAELEAEATRWACLPVEEIIQLYRDLSPQERDRIFQQVHARARRWM